MTITQFAGSGLKNIGIPVRYRNGGLSFGKWILYEPEIPERTGNFVYSWQLVDGIKDGSIPPEKISNFGRTAFGEPIVATQLIRDVFGLTGDEVTPWAARELHRGR